MKGRDHSPHTGAGRERRQSHGKAPGGIGRSWPTQGRMPANSLGLRRKAKPRNPDCTTDRNPGRAVITGWMRQGFTLRDAENFVRTRFAGDTLYIRALDVYRKMAEAGAVEAGSDQTSFPLAASDLRRAVYGSSILEHIE